MVVGTIVGTIVGLLVGGVIFWLAIIFGAGRVKQIPDDRRRRDKDHHNS